MCAKLGCSFSPRSCDCSREGERDSRVRESERKRASMDAVKAFFDFADYVNKGEAADDERNVAKLL